MEFKKSIITTYENKIDNYNNIKNIKNLTFNTKPFNTNNNSNVLDKLILFFEYMKKMPIKEEKKDEDFLIEEDYKNKIFGENTKIPSSIVYNKKNKILSFKKSTPKNNYIEIKRTKNINHSPILKSVNETEYNLSNTNKKLLRNKTTSYNYDLENFNSKRFNIKKYSNIELCKDENDKFLEKESDNNENNNLFNSVDPKKIAELNNKKINIK